MTCDIKDCINEAAIYGRWVAYCEPHKIEGKAVDWQKTYDNELSGGDYTNLDGEVEDMILEYA